MGLFNNDDSGASMLLEYIFLIIISALLFTMLLMNLGSIMSKSDRIVMDEEVDIAASIVANQLADYSNELYLNDITLRMSDYSSIYSMADTQDDNFRYFNLPKPYSGRQYIIEVQDSNEGLQRGIVKVTYVSDPGVYSVANFNSPVPVKTETIICNSYNMKVSYDPSANEMVLEEV
jgi:hypothetical protein